MAASESGKPGQEPLQDNGDDRQGVRGHWSPYHTTSPSYGEDQHSVPSLDVLWLRSSSDL